MSRFGKFLAAALLLFGLTALAQESSEPPATPAPAPTPVPRHHPTQTDPAEKRLKRLSKRLSLTDDQKEKLRPILQDEAKQMKVVDDDASLTPQQRHKKTREIRMASRSQMDGILTDEQKKQLQSERPHGAGPHHGRHSAPAPGTTAPDSTTPQ